MAGGAGERFWPLSTSERPKQLLHLADPSQSLLEQTVERARALFPTENTFVAASRSLETAIREARLLPDANVFSEPDRRNTLGATCWAVSQLLARGYDRATLMAILPSDHAIGGT